MSLLILGVGHVFRIEDAIRGWIGAERPHVVALELDAPRFEYLRQRAQGRPDLQAARKSAPAAYRRLAKFQQEIAQGLGVDVGGEMVAAAQAAQAVGSRLALIDADAQGLVARAWREMSLRERARLLWESIAVRFPWRKSSSVEAELERYHKDPAAYLAEFGRMFPTIKRLLLDERNAHMAAHLRRLEGAGKERIVAVVGDGHVDGIVALLGDLKPRVVRLQQLQSTPAGNFKWRVDAGRGQVGFSFDQSSLEDSLRGG